MDNPTKAAGNVSSKVAIGETLAESPTRQGFRRALSAKGYEVLSIDYTTPRQVGNNWEDRSWLEGGWSIFLKNGPPVLGINARDVMEMIGFLEHNRDNEHS